MGLHATLFPPYGYQSRIAYRHTVISSFLRAMLVMLLVSASFPMAQFWRWLLSNCSRCSILKVARPKRFLDKVQDGPGVPSSSISGCAFDVSSFVSNGADSSMMPSHTCPLTQWKTQLNVSRPPICDFVQGPLASKTELLFQALTPLSNFSCIHRLFLNIRPLGGPHTTYSLVRFSCCLFSTISPVWPHPLCNAGKARRVICRRRPTLSRTCNQTGSISSAVVGALWLDASPHIGSPVLR
jgi:hypothetical protein